MALDGLVVHAIVHELQSCIGSRIHKIYQPDAHDIVFHMRIQRSNKKLLLSAQPTYPRVHFTDEPFVNPAEAPMFCMLMRKHCENGIIESITQVGMERIIHIDIQHRNELGDTGLKRIIIELMGRHSNIILLDPETKQIFGSVQHVTPAISSHRVVLPGTTYIAPPEQNKHNPLTTSVDDIEAILSQHTELEAKHVVASFSGISPLVGAELVYRSEATETNIATSFAQMLDNIRLHHYEPTIRHSQQKSYFSVIELSHIDGEEQRYPSISECLQAFYTDKAERDAIKQRVSDLLRFLQNEKNKNVRKLKKLNNTLRKAQHADRFKTWGELLTASLHEVKQGDDEIQVVDYYDPELSTVTISLDPQLSPAQNAQRYFTKYRKAKNSLTIVQQQIEQTENEIQYIDSLLQQLDNASLSDIDEIREELIEQRYIRARATKKTRKAHKQKKPQLHCFQSSEGIPIYVGKNNTQNDYLTSRLAHSTDTWLHTKDIPGSHVVIRSQSFDETTLQEAAMLAAYYSQARQSSQVPVDYTLIRHVRKPNGAKPGYVIYDNQKTLFITPDEKHIKQLKLEIK